jgi:hypothetical protein
MNSNANIVLDNLTDDIMNAAVNAIDATMRRAKDFAQSPTDKVQPPAKKGEQPRKAYPGGWSDVTSTLINSLTINKAKRDGSSLISDLFTDVEYAEKLDGRKRANGGTYYVLTGLDDDFDFEDEFDQFFSDAIAVL